MTKEGIMWILTMLNVVVCAGYFIINVNNRNENLQFLVTTYQAETDIQDASIAELFNSINSRAALSYQEGFEAGRTQSGIAFLHNGTMQSYGDGYHAALSQWGEADPTGKPKLDIPPVGVDPTGPLTNEENELLDMLLEDIGKQQKAVEVKTLDKAEEKDE